MQTLSSIKDDLIAQARQLSAPAARKQLQKLVLYGAESILWALRSEYRMAYILCCEKLPPELEELAASLHIDCYAVSAGIAKKITDTSHVIPHIGIARLKRSGIDYTGPLVVLDDIRDHGNIGTIIRTAAAFGFGNIALTNTAYDIYYRNIITASRGLALKVSFSSLPADALLETLKAHAYSVVTTSPYGTVGIGDERTEGLLRHKKIAVVLGNESSGASDIFMKNADALVRLDMQGCVESLNVGVFAGIILHRLKAVQP